MMSSQRPKSQRDYGTAPRNGVLLGSRGHAEAKAFTYLRIPILRAYGQVQREQKQREEPQPVGRTYSAR